MAKAQHTPQTAVLQVVEEAAPRESSTDKIERVLSESLEDQKKSDLTAH